MMGDCRVMITRCNGWDISKPVAMEGQQVFLYKEGVIETPTQLARSFLLKASNSTKAKALAFKVRSGKSTEWSFADNQNDLAFQ